MDGAADRSAFWRSRIQKLAVPWVRIWCTTLASTFPSDLGAVEADWAVAMRSPVNRATASGTASRARVREASPLRIQHPLLFCGPPARADPLTGRDDHARIVEIPAEIASYRAHPPYLGRTRPKRRHGLRAGARPGLRGTRSPGSWSLVRTFGGIRAPLGSGTVPSSTWPVRGGIADRVDLMCSSGSGRGGE